MTSDVAQQKEQRFSVGQHSELSVSNVSGHIAVDADEGSEIVVRYSKAGSFRTQDNIQVDIRKDGNRVTVQTRPNVGGLINFGRGRSVDYNITVPRDCACACTPSARTSSCMAPVLRPASKPSVEGCE